MNFPVVVLENKDGVVGEALGQHDVIVFGLPFMRLLGRVAWLDGGASMSIGMDAPSQECFATSGRFDFGLPLHRLYSEVEGGGFAPFVLDTGMVASGLFRETQLKAYASHVRVTKNKKFRSRSGNNVVVSTGVRNVRLLFADAPVALKNIPVRPFSLGGQTDTSPLAFVGIVGAPAIEQTSAFVIDFEAMTFAAAPRSAKEWRRCSRP